MRKHSLLRLYAGIASYYFPTASGPISVTLRMTRTRLLVLGKTLIVSSFLILLLVGELLCCSATEFSLETGEDFRDFGWLGDWKNLESMEDLPAGISVPELPGLSIWYYYANGTGDMKLITLTPSQELYEAENLEICFTYLKEGTVTVRPVATVYLVQVQGSSEAWTVDECFKLDLDETEPAKQQVIKLSIALFI
jgi:hypothetical protein